MTVTDTDGKSLDSAAELTYTLINRA